MPRFPALLLLCAFALVARADESDMKARVEEDCARVAKALEAWLGPRFQGPVPVAMKTKKELGDFARETAKELMPSELVETTTRLAVRLKQIPPGYDLMEKQIELLEQMVAGLYDPRTDTFFVAEGTGAPGTMLFTITVAHELVHAYRDVDHDYFDRMLASVETDADWTVGVQFLVEGDANLLGLALGQAEIAKSDPKQTLKMLMRSPEGLRDMMLAGAQSPEIKAFPRMLRESLIAPYAYGLLFAAKILEKGGLEALEQAYRRPPRSTEQVLHPEKYLGETPDEPMVIEGAGPSEALGEGWAMALSNVMGEFEMKVHFADVLGDKRAAAAAAGWDGTRYWFCTKEGAPDFFGMTSTWDTEADAAEFGAAWALWASRRDGETREVRAVFDGLDLKGYDVDTKDGLVAVRLHDADVFVADGVPRDRLAPVIAALARVQKTERVADATPVR